MRNLKKTRYFLLGRKWVFTLALFILVFAAASVVKVQAVGNVTGWLWGGSEDCDMDKNGFQDVVCGGNNTSTPLNPNYIDTTVGGNETGVGWISMSGDNPEAPGGEDYGVTIPTSDGAVTGYAWMNAGGNPDNGLQNGIGWIQFDSAPDNARYPGCGYPAIPCNNVMRNGDYLEGWARFISIKDALAANNSGGWEGWIKMRGPNYGVQISKMLGVGSGSHTYAWSEELGAIDFGQAKAPCAPLPGGCGPALGMTYCSSGLPAGPPAASDLCNSESVLKDPPPPSGSAPWNWQCVSNTCPGTGSLIASCGPVNYTTPEIGQCGTAATQNFCGKDDGPTSDLCLSGTASVPSKGYAEWTWTCGKTICGGTVVECSAPGNHCGWIETNP